MNTLQIFFLIQDCCKQSQDFGDFLFLDRKFTNLNHSRCSISCRDNLVQLDYLFQTKWVNKFLEEVKLVAKENILSFIKENDLCLLATVLDPRCKAVLFTAKKTKTSKIKVIKR